MKQTLVFLLVIPTFFLTAQSNQLLYSSNFDEDVRSDFHFTDGSAWKIEEGTLELFGESDYSPPVRSPWNIAILKDEVVGDFTLEVDLKQTGREYGHRDMCLFFGINDPANFYYVHIASVADDKAHNIFIVNNEDRRNIATKTNEGADWGDKWNKVKIERNIEKGTILVYFNDMEQPIMEATDSHFKSGYIGVGSFDDTGKVDNLKLFGQRAELSKFF